MAEGVRLATVGLVVGVAGAFAVARLMRALFVDVAPGDPRTLASVGLMIALVAAVASWLPGRRATGVDPLGAMRGE
jgi:ABC-type lipoprotein release transport system permease subunit